MESELRSELDYDDWSEDEVPPGKNDHLETELQAAKAEIAKLRKLLRNSMEEEPWVEVGKDKAVARDDDTHYFDSYAENGKFSSMSR